MAKQKMLQKNPENFHFAGECCGSWLAPGHLMVGRYPMLQKSKVGFASP